MNWYDYGFRNYDPQIGRFPQLDPLADSYPYYTPFQFAGNDPIANVDLDGLEQFGVLGGLFAEAAENGGKAKVLGEVVVRSTKTFVPAAKIVTNTTSRILSGVSISVKAAMVSNQVGGIKTDGTTCQGCRNAETQRQLAGRTNPNPGYRESSVGPAQSDDWMSEPDKEHKHFLQKSFYENQGLDEHGNPGFLTRLGNNETWNRFTDHVLVPAFEIETAIGTGKLLKWGVKKVLSKFAVKKVAQYTRSTLSLGREMHNAYKADVADGVNMIKEFRLPSGKRIDFLDIPNSTIYELKPFNPRAMQQGQRQLNTYMNELRNMPRFRGIQWTTILDKY